MKKKTAGLLLAGAMTLGVLGGIQAFAADDAANNSTVESNSQHSEHKMKHGWGHDGKKSEEQLIQEAQKFGISTEGKDGRELRKEVMEAKIKKEAQELGIATDGKDVKDLGKEVMEARIKKEAQELGIATDGKDLRDLAKEVHETKVLNAAKELGITTENKSTREIMKEIMENHSDKAKELGLFPSKGQFGSHGFGPHHKHEGHNR